jgi:hypothetical protein
MMFVLHAYEAHSDGKARNGRTLEASAVVVAQTNPVGISGTYFISASALPFVVSGDSFTFCYDALTSSGSASQYGGGDTAGGYMQASISDVLFVGAGDSIRYLCYSGGVREISSSTPESPLL